MSFKFIPITITFILFSLNFINPQSVTNYTFIHSTQGSLTDMSQGSVDVLVPQNRNSEFRSNVHDIGFNFIFMGKSYNKFSANSNGLLALGDERIQTWTFNTFLYFLYDYSIIAPFWDNLNQVLSQITSGKSKIRIKLDGSIPNRVLTIEWKDFVISYDASTDTATSTFQVKLFESTNNIEFVYGRMQIAPGSNNVTATIGFLDSASQGRAIGIANLSAPIAVTNISQIPNNLVNSNVPGYINGLHSNNEQERVSYKFIPRNLIPSAPTNLTFSNINSNSFQISWADNDTSECYYLVRIEENSAFIKEIYLPANSNSYVATGLKPGINYTVSVYATNEGRISAPLSGNVSTLSAVYSGEYYVGAGARIPDFLTLTEAITKINQFGIAGTTVLKLQSNYSSQNESFPITLSSGLNLSPDKSFIIRPSNESVNIEIVGNNNVAIFDFNNCDYAIIDGRSSDDDEEIKLTLKNENTSAPVIRFINSSSYNTIRYCNILGANKSNINGVILFSTSPQNSRGNSYNKIEYCSIGNSIDYPVCGITSTGANSAFNLYNKIRYCNIYNFVPNSSIGEARGIFIHSMASRWTIEGNSFYQKNSVNFTFAGGIVGIDISSGSYSNQTIIRGNYIGGSDKFAKGNR